MIRYLSMHRLARIARVLGQAGLRSDPMLYCQYLAATAAAADRGVHNPAT
jgi:hypothetical protein